MNKSRPLYQPLALDPRGGAHLILSGQPDLPSDAIAGGLSKEEIWLPDSTDMLARLATRLADEKIGLRLYAFGTEAFLWDVGNIARRAGLGDGEVFLSQAGSWHRRVYCTHCRTMLEDVTTSIATCPSCGSNLLVRDHFSKRLAAFMGVAVDAEVPGEVPEPELLYP